MATVTAIRTTGLQAIDLAFARLLEQARDQFTDHEYLTFLDLATRRVAKENARVLPFRLREAA